MSEFAPTSKEFYRAIFADTSTQAHPEVGDLLDGKSVQLMPVEANPMQIGADATSGIGALVSDMTAELGGFVQNQALQAMRDLGLLVSTLNKPRNNGAAAARIARALAMHHEVTGLPLPKGAVSNIAVSLEAPSSIKPAEFLSGNRRDRREAILLKQLPEFPRIRAIVPEAPPMFMLARFTTEVVFEDAETLCEAPQPCQAVGLLAIVAYCSSDTGRPPLDTMAEIGVVGGSAYDQLGLWRKRRLAS